ncbi:MAG: alpha/beta fold hydrolase [Rhizobacter sp.]|nr:alpha/beta fold hydrolase [Rhizobacter sp.]
MRQDTAPRRTATATLLLAASLVAACTTAALEEKTATTAKQPIVLESTGAFEVGGKVISNPADPKQTLSCDHGYVEYFIPAKRRQTGLIFWHSSSTKVWENRWDGGEGYKSIFLRKRYPVYLWDGPRVGRANWSCEPIHYKPEYFDQRNFLAWRFGPSFGKWNPGVQFPTNDPQAWEQATRARYDEFDTLANALLQAEAGGQAIDKIGPVVAVTNSAGGWRALLSALKARTGNLKGLISYENPGYVFPEGEGVPPAPQAPFGPNSVPLSEFKKLTRFPMQMVFGDNASTHPSWSVHLKNTRTFCELVNKHGGDCEVLLLPDVGLRGNSHIPFADMNNDAVADEMTKWLHRKGLDQ